jgi:hypothetical protein
MDGPSRKEAFSLGLKIARSTLAATPLYYDRNRQPQGHSLDLDGYTTYCDRPANLRGIRYLIPDADRSAPSYGDEAPVLSQDVKPASRNVKLNSSLTTS